MKTNYDGIERTDSVYKPRRHNSGGFSYGVRRFVRGRIGARLLLITGCALSLSLFSPYLGALDSISHNGASGMIAISEDHRAVQSPYGLSDNDNFTDTYAISSTDCAFVLTITDAGIDHTIVFGGGTVSQALEEAGLEPPDSDDIVTPAADQILEDGMNITVDRVTYEEYTVIESIPFDTVKRENPDLKPGDGSIITLGSDGEKRIVRQRKWVNGELDSETVISETVTREPIEEIVEVGKGKNIETQNTTKRTTVKTTASTKKPTTFTSVKPTTTKATTTKATTTKATTAKSTAATTSTAKSTTKTSAASKPVSTTTKNTTAATTAKTNPTSGTTTTVKTTTTTTARKTSASTTAETTKATTTTSTSAATTTTTPAPVTSTTTTATTAATTTTTTTKATTAATEPYYEPDPPSDEAEPPVEQTTEKTTTTTKATTTTTKATTTTTTTTTKATTTTTKADEKVFTDSSGRTVSYSRKITGKGTAYTEEPGSLTASGRPVAVGLVAVDPNVIPYGTSLYIVSADGKYVYGYATAADTGGALRSGKVVVDLFYDTEAKCNAFGRRDVIIYVL